MLGHYLSWTRLVLLAAAVGFTLVLAQDARPAQTATTKVYISRAEATVQAPIVLFPNGPIEQIHVRVSDVKDPTGVSAFEVDMEFPSTLASVFQMNANLPWLSSTGRTATCSTPTITQTTPTIATANVSCNTLGTAPPYGATTAGGIKPPLATLYLEPGAVSGNGLLKLTTVTKLVNTPLDPDDIAAIPITRQNSPLVVARCADFNGDNVVSVIDIVRLVAHFGQTDPFYDLNNDGLVTIGDISITIMQFGLPCPPA
jgi:hypothetical protein